MIRSVRLNQRGAPVKNPLQLDRVVLVLGEVQRTHLHQFHLLAPDPDHAVPHDGGAGVDAQDDLFRRGLGGVGRHAPTKVHLEMRIRYIVTAAALGYIAWALTDHSIWSDAAALKRCGTRVVRGSCARSPQDCQSTLDWKPPNGTR